MATLGSVHLVGAGPGDPDLITTKGRKALGNADVILYDALAHPQLLELCRPDAELHYVGKRAGRASERQANINAQLVAHAQKGKRVVRLKGGDPYLFGRGSEEAEVLAEAGIPFEVVPGVPSPLAATAYAGLSLTHRALSSSVAYITATESVEKDATSHDWAKLATATQTLVIFMGRRKLRTLMALLEEHGRPPETPVAIVHWASLPKQRTLVGTVATIADLAENAALGLPSLIIVGNVVRLRDKLRWFDRKPLFGRRVLITRAKHQSSVLAARLREAGAEALVAPTFRVVPPEDPQPLQAAVAALGNYHWILFTSANTVAAVMEELQRQGGDARRFGDAKICAIGPKTADALRAHGLRPDLVPEQSRAEGLLEAFRGHCGERRRRFLLPRAEVARAELPEGLRSDGHLVDVVTAYRTADIDDAQRTEVLEAFAAAEVVPFGSGAAVDRLVALVGADALKAKTLASIGPITTGSLEKHGLQAAIEAPAASIEALVEAIEAYYGTQHAAS